MARSIGRKVATSPVRIKTSFTLTPETFRKLGAACVAEDMTQSEVAEKLFSEALSGYFVVNRGDSIAARKPNGPAGRNGPVNAEDRRESAAEISPPASDAA